MKWRPWHKSAALTGLIGLFIISVAFNLSLSSIYFSDENYYPVTAELIKDQTEKEIPNEKDTKSSTSREIRTHRAFNEQRKEMLEEIRTFKTLEELREEKQSDEQINPNEGDIGLDKPAALPKDHVKAPEEKPLNPKKEDKSPKANNRKTSVSYSLRDRESVYIPIPIYTCMVSGKIVVNIRVSADGEVTEASINTAGSSSSDGCLIDQALEYAYRARFNAASGRQNQLGSITYNFVGK